MVSSPKAPDPAVTAAAQSGMNRDTATQQQLLNMVDQNGPDGSLSYIQNGANSYVGSDGKVTSVPRFLATTTLSPAQQAIKTQSDQTSLNIGKIANERSDFLGDYLAKPFSVDGAVEDKLYDLGTKRLDPRFAQQEEGLRTRLANQGVREGSAAYDAAFGNFSQGKNDAYNQLALNGRGQAFQEASYERALPLNEIGALMSGSQVQMPQFEQTPQTGVAGVDYAGLVNQKYQSDSQRAQGAMGGLFGLLSAPFALSKFSDRSLKMEIKRVGALDNGLTVYSYRLGQGPVEIGLLADEVEAINEAAVSTHPSGFKMVNYALATEAA